MKTIPLRNHFKRTGEAKVGYDTMEKARAAADRQQQRCGSNRRPYHAYECGDCHKFHIGKRPARPSQRGKSGRRAA